MVFGDMIKSIYIVGGSGFIGQNLFHTLRFNPDLEVFQISKEQILSGKFINLTSNSALYLLSGVSRARVVDL
jgi:N-acetyl-gamma-glutamylphosphate reductase